MKLIKKNSTTKKITDAFKVGDAAKWLVSMFDGRISTFKEYTGTIVKVNRKTVDVEVANGNVYRLDAFIKISTGEWTLGVR
jgi:ribosomal protein L21E